MEKKLHPDAVMTEVLQKRKNSSSRPQKFCFKIPQNQIFNENPTKISAKKTYALWLHSQKVKNTATFPPKVKD